MVGCPRCGGSSAVQIARDGTPSLHERVDTSPRWRARCEECGAEWTFRD